MMEKVNLVLGGVFGAAPRGAGGPADKKPQGMLKDTVADLERAGFKVKR